ncbi:MAG: HNH endonuclease [Patescibacteria group bacterium]|nr:HNH endonuclease [Patescibacteria group bacterium]
MIIIGYNTVSYNFGLIMSNQFCEIPIKQRLLEGYELDKKTGCWIWQRSCTWRGDPRISKTKDGKTKYFRAKRISYEIYNGKIPKDNFIKHICKNIKCINPAHLNLGNKCGKERKSILERFENSYIKNEKTGCWEWIKGLDRQGYGQIHDYDKQGKRITRYAHRISFEIYKHKIPNNKLICHSCDNPKCVNPKHLWIGTTQENVDDKLKKNRGLFGSKHQNSKLTEEDILFIRSSKARKSELARKFNVHFMTITNILRRNTWKHVK